MEWFACRRLGRRRSSFFQHSLMAFAGLSKARLRQWFRSGQARTPRWGSNGSRRERARAFAVVPATAYGFGSIQRLADLNGQFMAVE